LCPEAAGRLRRAVEASLFERLALPHGAHVLVAWSGGPDSSALAWACASLERAGRLRCFAAHVDHGLRKESVDEAETVLRRAAALELPCALLRPPLAKGPGAQARARAARYAALHAEARRTGSALVLTAHTRDDQAETVLMRLLRGAGVRGLRGILPVTIEGLGRPLLEVSRETVTAALESLGLPSIEDPSNKDRRFLRVRVRHELLPNLERSSPGATRRLVALADGARRLWREAEPLIEGIHPGRALPRSRLLNLPAFCHGPALERWLGSSLSTPHIEGLARLARGAPGSPSRRSAPGAHTVHRIGGYLVAGPREGPPDLERAFAGVAPV
jgi:tRNA(Ile)-lysidine synthase